MVKCAPSVAGGPDSDTGHKPTHYLSDHAVVASHIKWRKIGMDVRSGKALLSNYRRIGMAVHSGLILLTKKKEKKPHIPFRMNLLISASK